MDMIRDVINKLSCIEYQESLMDSVLFEEVQEKNIIYYNTMDIMKAKTKLPADMKAEKQIKLIMQEIVQVVNSDAEDIIAKVNNLTEKLAMLLTVPLKNPADYLVYTEPCLKVLALCLDSVPENGRLHENVATLTRKLCISSFHDTKDDIAVTAIVSSGMLYQYLGMIQNGIGVNNKMFLIGAYSTLAAVAANPSTNETSLKQVAMVLPQTYELLNLYQHDVEIVACIQEFLKYMVDNIRRAESIISACYDDEYGKETEEKKLIVEQSQVNDQLNVETCKSVYDFLQNRVQQKQSVSVANAVVLESQITFLFMKMNDYGQKCLDHATTMGEDHEYGNRAFEIFCSDATNIPLLITKDLMNLELSCIKNQTDDDIIFYAVATLNAFCKHSYGAESCALITECPAIITDAISKIQNNTSYSNETREKYLIERIALVESVAINRNIFNNTDIISKLVECWDDYDKDKYSTKLLRQVLRSLRKAVSDKHAEVLLKLDILKRLINIINDVNTDMAILPDVLFLLGTLAVVPEINTKIGELEGIDACVKILTRALASESFNAHLINCCLALSNICSNHQKNAAIFLKLNGPQLNVEVLRKSRTDFDVISGATVLLCNLLYKNEPIKKLYGSFGAADALVKALHAYNGSEEPNAIRYLNNLFKAISSMLLYTPNVALFLQANIQDSLAMWLENVSSTFPDKELEIGLRIISNLVVVNEQTNMRRFGVTLLPCIRIIGQNRKNAKIYMLLLDILFSLCRLNENAEMFAVNGGIDVAVRIAHQFNYDVSLLAADIRVLGIQSTLPKSIDLLMKADVFSILVRSIKIDEEENKVTELVTAALRCSRRIIQNSHLAEQYINAGGVSAIYSTICKSVNQRVVMFEACRVLLALLNFSSGVNVKINNETAPNAAGATGGWKRLGMDVSMIEAILQTLCVSIRAEASAKELRFCRVALGIFAYFAAEHCGINSSVSFRFGQTMISVLNFFAGDPGITKTICIAISNIATSSADLYEAMYTEKLTSSLQNSINKLSAKKAENKKTKAACLKILAAMKSGANPSKAFLNEVMEYDLSLTEWNKEPYSKGVQDLPEAVKKALIKGGKVEVFTENKEREVMKWRSSQDLNIFEWNIGSESEWNNHIPIIRIKSIMKGLMHPALENANKKEPRKVTSKVCLCINGIPTEDKPNGVVLPIKMKNQKERDAFVEMLLMWRNSTIYYF